MPSATEYQMGCWNIKREEVRIYVTLPRSKSPVEESSLQDYFYFYYYYYKILGYKNNSIPLMLEYLSVGTAIINKQITYWDTVKHTKTGSCGQIQPGYLGLNKC